MSEYTKNAVSRLIKSSADPSGSPSRADAVQTAQVYALLDIADALRKILQEMQGRTGDGSEG